MPTFNTTVKSSQSVWKSPDGQREIFEVILDYQGQSVTAKTYSQDIAREGWSGEVESYEKEGKRGKEIFVKQVSKAGYGGGGNYSRGGGGGGKAQADPYTMYLSYAKDLAIASLSEGKLDEELFGQLLDAVKLGGGVLYESRPDAPKEASHAEEKSTSEEPARKDSRGEDFIDWTTIDTVFPE